MKKYKVTLHPDAEMDINSSFEWGCRAWGKENATAWGQTATPNHQKSAYIDAVRLPACTRE